MALTPNHALELSVKACGVLLQIRVKPRARTSELVQDADGKWQARVKSPPVDGKANES